MPELKNRQFLDFEKPIKDLYDQIELQKTSAEKSKIDASGAIKMLEDRILETKKHLTENVTPWQKVQLSRHPDRPYTLKFIEKMCTDFIELHGDRNVKDDKAMVGGFAKLGGETVMVIGQQKPTLVELRAKLEKHIKNNYLKRIDAPVGVKPALKCWMELNEG